MRRRDLAAIALRHLNFGRQIFSEGISERDFATLDHVRQTERSENFCYLADFVHRVAVDGTIVVFRQRTVGAYAAA
jgi:hypothetical protein